jgi:hypothetical protein
MTMFLTLHRHFLAALTLCIGGTAAITFAPATQSTK